MTSFYDPESRCWCTPARAAAHPGSRGIVAAAVVVVVTVSVEGLPVCAARCGSRVPIPTAQHDRGSPTTPRAKPPHQEGKPPGFSPWCGTVPTSVCLARPTVRRVADSSVTATQDVSGSPECVRPKPADRGHLCPMRARCVPTASTRYDRPATIEPAASTWPPWARVSIFQPSPRPRSPPLLRSRMPFGACSRCDRGCDTHGRLSRRRR